MTSPPSRPSRRRRSVIVTMAVFLLVSLWSWWYWPRIDPRFVGKWTIAGDGIWGWRESFEFKSDGQVEFFQYRAGQMEIRQLRLSRWSMVGSRLILAEPPPSLRNIRRLPEYWIGRVFGGGERRYEVLEITPSAMHLRDATGGVESQYIR